MGAVALEYVDCNLCGADDTQLIYPSTLDRRRASSASAHLACTNDEYGIHPPIVRCRRCGLVYANPRPTAGELRAGYAAMVDPLYVRERRGRELTFRRYLDHMVTRLGLDGHVRLLDVGCHVGVFLEQARAYGWNTWGVEPSQWAVAQAQARRLRVIEGMLADTPFEAEYFDVVTLWDVIEHLPDPLGDLRRLARLIRSGGWVCVHTMDVDSLFARLMGRRWPWLMEMHLYYFSRSTLTAMLQRAGFRVVEMGARGRVLRLGYVVSRLVPYSARLAGVIRSGVQALGLTERHVLVSLGDLFTTYARKE